MKAARPFLLTWFSHFRRAQEKGVAGVAQEAVDLFGPGSTHAASLLDGLNGTTGGAERKWFRGGSFRFYTKTHWKKIRGTLVYFIKVDRSDSSL